MDRHIIKARRKLPKRLEDQLVETMEFEGEYEYERDYTKVYKKLLGTTPFSVLVFYENLSKRITKKRLVEIKKENPKIPGRILMGGAFYEQFYFVPELKEIRVGTYLGSGYRSTQGTYALALANLSKTMDIPTDILIIEENGSPKHVKHSDQLIVQPHEVTQNVNLELANDILKNTIKAYGVRKDQGIRGILIDNPHS